MRLDPATSLSIQGRGSLARRCFCRPGTIDRFDADGGKLYVDLTKDQIKDSPEFDQSSYNDPAYRSSVGDYYGGYYTG